MNNLLARTARRHLAFVAVAVLLLAGFEFLICAVVATLDVSGLLSRAMTSLPPPLRALMAERFFAGFTPRGLLAFGWNHPVTQALGGALAILLATRALAGEIGAGTLELVLAGPLTRRRYFAGVTIFALLAIAALAVVGSLGTIVGARVYGLPPLPLASVAYLAASFFLLQASWFGLALLASAGAGQGSRPANLVFLAAVASYLIEVIGRLWQPAALLGHVSLYHYYAPIDIVVNGTTPSGWAVVPGAVAVIASIAAARRFERRDIP